MILTAAANLLPKIRQCPYENEPCRDSLSLSLSLSQVTGCTQTENNKYTMQYVLMCRTEILIYALRRRCQQPSAFQQVPRRRNGNLEITPTTTQFGQCSALAGSQTESVCTKIS
jgi:hypothetical protein